MTVILFMLIVQILSSTGFIAVMMMSIVANRCVPGSHRRYQAVTVIITLVWPTIIGTSITMLAAAVDRNLLSTTIELLWIILLYREWRRSKDEDNWWTGRGKKWLQSLDSKLSRFHPSPAAG